MKSLGGFDGIFFYHYDETDLCYRIWKSGSSIVFCPDAKITHLGGQSVGRFPIRFALEIQRSLYYYFHKHYGGESLAQIRRIALLHYWMRRIGYGLINLVRASESRGNRLKMYKVVIDWHRRINPARFIQTGEEPDLGYPPFAPGPKAVDTTTLDMA